MAKNTICVWYDKDAEAAARFGASLGTTIAGYVADMFGAAAVFLFLGSIGAFGFFLVLALMPETREAASA